jgi:hypothetical protein
MGEEQEGFMLRLTFKTMLLTFLLAGVLNGNTTSVACPDDQAVLNQGVWILVNGSAHLRTGAINPQDEVVITNGRVCLSMVPNAQVPEARTFVMEVRVKGQWQPGTSLYYGDWTYVGSGVKTPPTEVEVLSWSPREAGIRWTFGNHVAGADVGAIDSPYPFTKTVWLRRNEYGYFAWIEPLVQLPRESWCCNQAASEHEIGFGGIWGPGTVETAEGLVHTEDLERTYEVNLSGEVDAAEFIYDEDPNPVKRILVPLPGGPLIVAVFDWSAFGSVWIHHRVPRSYGAYLYAAPFNKTKSARAICKYAWRRAPFSLPHVSAAELATCGPEP